MTYDPIIAVSVVSDWLLILAILGFCGQIIMGLWNRFSSWKGAHDRLLFVEQTQKNLVLSLSQVNKGLKDLHAEVDEHVKSPEMHVNLDMRDQLKRTMTQVDWIYQNMGGNVRSFVTKEKA